MFTDNATYMYNNKAQNDAQLNDTPSQALSAANSCTATGPETQQA